MAQTPLQTLPRILPVRQALISVSDKTGLLELARGLELCGVSGDIASGRASGPELQDEVRALCASAQAWLASQTDVLAEDWSTLPS